MNTYRIDTSLLVLVVAILGAVGCASATRQTDTMDLLERPRTQSTRQIIAQSEIGSARASTAYDVVARLRPEFLRPRDYAGSRFEPVVYINGLLAGGVAVLSEIAVGTIEEVRYVMPEDAVMRHGEAHRGGEIMLYIRR